MIEVVKGQHIRRIHSIDLSAWVRDGWEIKNGATVEEPPVTVTEEKQQPAPVVDAAELTEELETASWQEIKALATELGLVKPDEKSWAEFIPDIVAAKLA